MKFFHYEGSQRGTKVFGTRTGRNTRIYFLGDENPLRAAGGRLVRFRGALCYAVSSHEVPGISGKIEKMFA